MKSIKGYEGLYSIDEEGNVYSLSRKKIDGRTIKERILKSSISSTGYYGVTLYKGGRLKRCHIHRLLAVAFIPNPNNYPCINHKDGTKVNNNLSNLEWCEYSYNNKDGYTRGRVVWNKGRKVKTNDALNKYIKKNGPWNKGKKTGIVPRSAFKKGNIPWNKL